MRRWIAMAFLGAMVLLPSAQAARRLNEFKPPQEMTSEELERSKALSRSNVSPYANQITEQVTPVPWKTIGLFALILAVAVPYAFRYYRATTGWEGNPRRRRRGSLPGELRPAPAAERLEAAGAPPLPRGQGRAYDETRVRAIAPSAPSAPSSPSAPSKDGASLPARRNTRP